MSSNSHKKRSSTIKEDYYTILGVERTATDEQIKQAYRKLALQLHPDKNPDTDTTVRFQEIAKAYKILGDPRLRSTYDLLGSQAADMIDQYDEYPGTISEMSPCKKILFGLVCCLTGCCCGFGFCCFCFGCCCCCDFCCNRCCGKCANSSVDTEMNEEQSTSHSQQPHSSIHRQPTNTGTDSTKF